MAIRVIKLGGTSQSLESYNNLVSLLDENKDDKFIIVVSAISEVTNLLLHKKYKIYIDELIKIHCDFIDELGIPELKNTIYAYIKYSFYTFNDTIQSKINRISLGEHLASIIINYYLTYKSISSQIIMAADIIKSDLDSTDLYQLKNIKVNSNILKNMIDKDRILITQGFIGSNLNNDMFLLGRGGSDTTGAILAKAVKANEYQIWTDVDGIFTTDPKLVKGASVINIIDYELAQEMAGMGAKILHPYCIKPCQELEIPILIKNSKYKNELYTTINNNTNNTSCAISKQSDISIFKITTLKMWHNIGFASDIFEIFTNNKIDIDVITTSQYQITVTSKNLDDNTIKNVMSELESKYKVENYNNYSMISIIKRNILQFDKLPELYKIFIKYDILLQTISSNNFTISCIINNSHCSSFINDIYTILF